MENRYQYLWQVHFFIGWLEFLEEKFPVISSDFYETTFLSNYSNIDGFFAYIISNISFFRPSNILTFDFNELYRYVMILRIYSSDEASNYKLITSIFLYSVVYIISNYP